MEGCRRCLSVEDAAAFPRMLRTPLSAGCPTPRPRRTAHTRYLCHPLFVAEGRAPGGHRHMGEASHTLITDREYVILRLEYVISRWRCAIVRCWEENIFNLGKSEMGYGKRDK